VPGAAVSTLPRHVGVMAATNETVEAKEFWILGGVLRP